MWHLMTRCVCRAKTKVTSLTMLVVADAVDSSIVYYGIAT